MTSIRSSRRLALLAGAAFFAVAPARADQLVAQVAADCREAKDHFEIARQIGTPEAYQAHIDAFGACPYASFARILKGQAEGTGGASAAGGGQAAEPDTAMSPAAPLEPSQPAAAEAPAGDGAATPDVAVDPFSGSGGAAAGADGQPAPVAIPDPGVASPAEPSASEAPGAATDVAEPQPPAAAPQPSTDEAKLLADTLADRLNDLQGGTTENGPRVRYDSAVLDNGDLFITNLRLTKDDGTPEWSGFVAPSAVVLKPVIEADGTFTASSIFMTKTSVRATEKNGPNDRVATISSISILDPRLAAIGAKPASDSLGAVDVRGIDIRSVVGFDPAGELLKIAAIQLTTNGTSDGLPQSATFSVKNLFFTPEQMARISESNPADLADLGPDFFDFTFTTLMQRDTAKRDLKLTEVFEIGKEANFTLSTAFGNFSPADIRLLLGAGDPSALIGLQVSLDEAEMNFVNTSLVDKVLAIAARQQNIDAPLFRAAIPSAARDAIVNSTGNAALAETVATALRTFLEDPRSLRLSLKPEQPLPLIGSAFQIAGSGDPVQATAMLSPSLSVNGGPPVPLVLSEPPAPADAAPPANAAPPADAAPPAEPAPSAADQPADGSSDQALVVPVDPLPLVPSPDGATEAPVPTPVEPEAPARSSASASVLAECDRLAADSDDPTKPAGVEGVKSPGDIDVKTALPACEAAHRLAPDDPRITFQLGRAYQAAGRDEEAARLYGEAADAGQSVAQYELALAYYDGRGVEQSPQKAIEQLQKSAALGNGFSKYFLGIEKVNGNYIPQDYPAAYQLFQEAVDFGVPEALVELGKMEYSGQGVPEDYDKAYAYYTQAAAKDVPGGYFYVGFMDSFGVGSSDATPLAAAQNMMKGLARGYADAEELIVTNSGQIFEPQVRQAFQDYLRGEGYYRGRSDGVFGPATLQAIKAWRTANNGG